MTDLQFLLILSVIPIFVVGLLLFRHWQPDRWYIGPRIRGKNYSKNLPLYPEKTSTMWKVTLDKPDQELDYITRSENSLKGVAAIRVKARVEGSFYQAEAPDHPATVSIILQRKGDDWTMKPNRWWLPHIIPLTDSGAYDITVRLDDPRWSPVDGDQSHDMQPTVDEIARVG